MIPDGLYDTILSRLGSSPDASYVASLKAAGIDKILKKVSEECCETLLAVKSGDRGQIVYETADLVFHVLVMLGQCGIGPDEIARELERRMGTSGIAEKNSRPQGRQS